MNLESVVRLQATPSASLRFLAMGLKLDQSSYECVFFIRNSEQVKGHIQSPSGLALGGKKRLRRQRNERCLVDYNDKECDGRKIRRVLIT